MAKRTNTNTKRGRPRKVREMKNGDTVRCCICQQTITPTYYGWTLGNNAEPLGNGRCCDSCNTLVLVARLRAL